MRRTKKNQKNYPDFLNHTQSKKNIYLKDIEIGPVNQRI